MRTIVSMVVVGAFIVACHHERPEIVAADIDAWSGVPVLELETHPRFSPMPRKVDRLSDGSDLWTLTNCVRGTEPVSCRSTPVFGTVVTNCQGGDSYTNCCNRLFRVSNGRVQAMTLSGACHTTCEDRPASHPCTPDDR